MPAKKFINLMDEKTFRSFLHNHHEHLKHAESKIDTKASKLSASSFLKIGRLKDDFESTKRILKDNVDLLMRINYIQRNRGRVDSYNTQITKKPKNLDILKHKLHLLERDNRDIGRRLLEAKSTLDTRWSPSDAYSLTLKSRAKKSKENIPVPILNYYMNLVKIKDSKLVEKLLRPKIFVDFKLRNDQALGRVVIQLYTEACPDLVVEIVRMCKLKKCQEWKFVRIFSQLWTELELTTENNILKTSTFDYQAALPDLNHSMAAGILSFSSKNLKGFPMGVVNFTISFKALPALNGLQPESREDIERGSTTMATGTAANNNNATNDTATTKATSDLLARIAFGRVVSGMKTVDTIRDFGTKNGKVLQEIIVADCGVIA